MTEANAILGNVTCAGLIFARNGMWSPYYLSVMLQVYKCAPLERIAGMVLFYSRRVLTPFS